MNLYQAMRAPKKAISMNSGAYEMTNRKSTRSRGADEIMREKKIAEIEEASND